MAIAVTDVVVLLAELGLILWLRRLHRLVPPKPARARDLEMKDPASVQHLVDSQWAEEAVREKQQRAELWTRAATDARAAKELRGRILLDLKLNKAARTGFGVQGESPHLVDEVDRDLRQQLAQVDAIIRSLHPVH